MQLNVAASSGQTAVLRPGGTLLIGSDPGCDLVLQAPQVADRHAFMRMDDVGVLTLQDLGAPAGVSISGTRVSGSATLQGNETIQLGGVTLTLSVTLAPAAPVPPAATAAAPVAPPAGTVPAPTPPAPDIPTAAMPTTSSVVASGHRSGSGTAVWIAVGVGVVAVIAIVAVVVLMRGGSEPVPSPVVVASPSPPPSPSPSPSPSAEPSPEPSPTPEVVTGAPYEGLVEGIYNGKFDFRFTPRCDNIGPCEVLGKSGAVYHFRYDPSSHTYSARATDRGMCEGSGPDFPYPIKRDITFRVLSSRTIGLAWKATSLDFSMKSSWPEVSRTVGNTRYFCEAGTSTTEWVGHLAG